MNLYSLRFTLSNTTLDDLVILDPLGWDTVPLRLTRHKTFNSVLETFSDNLTFHHTAIDYLKAIKDIGVDSQVGILAEISADYRATWETFYNGLVDVESLNFLQQPQDYKVQGGCNKNDVWQLFINRMKLPIDVMATTDQDGAVLVPPTLLDINLTPQTIRRHLRTEMYTTADTDFVDQIFNFAAHPATYGYTIDLPKTVYDELKTKFNYPNGVSEEIPPLPIIVTDDPASSHVYEIAIAFSESATYVNKINALFGCQLRYVSSGVLVANYNLVRTDLGVNGVNGRTAFTLSQTINDIKKGDEFSLVLQYGGAPGAPIDVYIVPTDYYVGFQTYFDLVAATLASPSESNAKTKAIRLFDVPSTLIKSMTGGDNFVSDFFNVGGCGYDYVNMLGAHLRGKSFADKIFAPSFDDWYKDACALFNLGLGFEGGKIVIKKRSEFYDSSSNSINFDFVNESSKTFIKGAAINSVQIGFTKSQLSAGGSLIDDFQTQHKYTSPLRLVGASITNLCRWIAAGLMFEVTRRAQLKPNETFDTDDDTFVLKVDGDNPDLSYVATSNINAPAERYNKTLTPARMFYTWLEVFSAGLKQYTANAFKFVSGLGNFIASVTIATDDCNPIDTVVENADINISSTPLFDIEQIDFTRDLVWEDYKLIRANVNKSIGVSETDSDHVPYFIDNIEFYLFEGKAKFTLFKAVV